MTNTFNLLRRLISLGFFALAGYSLWFILSRWGVYAFIAKGSGTEMLFGVLGAMTVAWIPLFAIVIWLGKTFWVNLDQDVE